MTNLNHLSKEELFDLLKAYDAYIIAAADSGRLTTGWVPVCISEFFSCEYQDVWRAGQNFDYMYGDEEHDILSKSDPLFSFNNVEIFFDDGLYLCRFDGEDEMRIIRDNIRDIETGDAFFIGTGLHYADAAAHQNFDEKDEPWIVYDVGGDGWFQEDIGDPKACIEAILLSQKEQAFRKPALDSLIKDAEKSATELPDAPRKTLSQKRR